MTGSLDRFQKLNSARELRRHRVVRHHLERVEDHWFHRQSHLRPAFSDPMDRFRARPQKCDPFWILGVQRNRITPDAKLLRDLPARLGGRLAKRAAASDLSSQSLFSLDTP